MTKCKRQAKAKSDHKRLAHQSCHPECNEGSLREILRYAQNDIAAESAEKVYEYHMLRFRSELYKALLLKNRQYNYKLPKYVDFKGN
jgi:hypothetical protein